MTTIISFVVVLGVLIFAHELGHFIFAKIFGVKVEEFGFGYPPRIFAKKFKGTTYSLNIIPFGGFCSLKGVVGDDRCINDTSHVEKNSFLGKKAWQKFFILAGGILFNFVFYLAVFTIIFSVGTNYYLNDLPKGAKIINRDPGIFVYNVVDGYPAISAGLKAGDVIYEVDGVKIETQKQFSAYNQERGEGSIVTLKTSNGDKQIALAKINTSEVGIGVELVETGRIIMNPIRAFIFSVKQAGFVIKEVARILLELLKGSVPQEIGGPVAIAKISGIVASEGIIPLLLFTALLSLNLAVVNFLPFPGLDGSHLFILAVESIIRRPLNKRIEAIVHQVGMALLVLLLILVTIRDIKRF